MYVDKEKPERNYARERAKEKVRVCVCVCEYARVRAWERDTGYRRASLSLSHTHTHTHSFFEIARLKAVKTSLVWRKTVVWLRTVDRVGRFVIVLPTYYVHLTFSMNNQKIKTGWKWNVKKVVPIAKT